MKEMRGIFRNQSLGDTLRQAADTIEALSAKLVKANMEQSEEKLTENELKALFPNMAKAIDQMFIQFKDSGITEKFLEISENAIEEYKTYKEIGTVEECHNAMERSEAYYGVGWIPCSERMPNQIGRRIKRYYIVSVKSEISDLSYVRPAIYEEDGFDVNLDEKVIAWQPLPKSYNSKE